MNAPSGDPTIRLRDELSHHLAPPDLDRVELALGAQSRIRVDPVRTDQRYFWISFVAVDENEFRIAQGARAAMRSFPWTEPFRARPEFAPGGLPMLCRWQRVYVEDTAALCVTLVDKHFRVDPGAVRIGSDSSPGGPKTQKRWLGEITAWHLRAASSDAARATPGAGPGRT